MIGGCFPSVITRIFYAKHDDVNSFIINVFDLINKSADSHGIWGQIRADKSTSDSGLVKSRFVALPLLHITIWMLAYEVVRTDTPSFAFFSLSQL